VGRIEVDGGSVDQRWPTRARSDGPGVNLNKPKALSLAPRLRCALYSRLASHLERFTRAQDQPHSGFAAAFAELRAGRKTGHWIWYVFPQLAGLGTSEASQLYGIRDGAEAIAYLRDPVLRGRLLSAATAVLERQRAGVPLAHLMGASIDLLKLVSSMTLFGHIAGRLNATEANDEHRLLAAAAEEILAGAESQGYPRCQYTLRSLEPS
jgi:uncharacterized protein (DUF1810 family)